MKMKALKNKRISGCYGHIVHTTLDSMEIWPSNIPDLFPLTASIETFTQMNSDRGVEGKWKKQITDYEMVTVELTIL